MNYNTLKNLSAYNGVYTKKPQPSYQKTDKPDPRKNKKWPMKTLGLPQFVCVTYYTAKTLGYDQFFPRSSAAIVVQHQREFAQTNFVNFLVSMRDGFKDELSETDYKEFVQKTNRRNTHRLELKSFYQDDLDKAPKKRKCFIKDTNETVDVTIRKYKPNLQVNGQDLRLLTPQKTKIDVTNDCESFISRGKIVAFSWNNSVIDLHRFTGPDYFRILGMNSENIISPKYPMLIELAFRQLQMKDILEGVIADDPKNIGTDELAIAANYLLNLYKVSRVFDVLKHPNERVQTSYQDQNRVKSDEEYRIVGATKGKKSVYPRQFFQSNPGEWSLIYKKDEIGHHRAPKSSKQNIIIDDELNELINLNILLSYNTDQSNFPEDVTTAMAVQNMQNIARKLNAALFVEPTIGVAIIGHTDCEASFSYNLNLSKERAKSIKAYLGALSKSDLGGLENFLKDESRIKVLGAGMLDCVAWDQTRRKKSFDRTIWNNASCRKISFEFFTIN